MGNSQKMDPLTRDSYNYVNTKEYHENIKLLRQGDIEYIVSKFLSDLILESEILFTSNDKQIKPTSSFLSLFNDNWLPLRSSLFEQLITLGLVIIRFKRSMDFPEIINTDDLGTVFNIRIISDNNIGKLKYEYILKDYQKRKPSNIYILYDFGFNPMKNGSLTCLMSKLRGQIEYRLLNYHCHMQAINILSNPEIIYRVDSKSISPKTRESLAVMDYNNETLNEEYPDEQAPINKLQRLLSKRMNDEMTVLTETQRIKMDDAERMILQKPYLREKQTSQLYPIFADGILSQHLPQVRGDWDAMHRVHFDIIANVFGKVFFFLV